MANLEGTKTLQNLMKAFAGESQARSRYTYYASVADKEGYKSIAAIFLETAENELEHAKVFFKHMAQYLKANTAHPVEIEAGYPVAYGNTYENLISAADGEREEWDILYKGFGDVAEEEGFADVAASFREISAVEAHHEKRYRALAEKVKAGEVFSRDQETAWKCRNCGYIHEGKDAPKVCPACKHGQAYFEIQSFPY